MFRRHKTAIMLTAAMALSSLIGMTSMATVVEGINGGPGVSMGSQQQPGVSGAPGTETGTPQASGDTAPAGQQTDVVTGVSAAVDTSTIEQAGPGYTPPDTSNMSSFTQELLNASRGIDNTDLSLTEDAGRVGPDPVL